MKYLILDDMEYKRDRIKEYVSSIDTEATFEEFSCTRDFMSFLRDFVRNKDKMKDYLLFLDWNFPFYAHEHIEVAEGEHILVTLELRHFEMKVIIVSSEEVEYNTEYPYVLGTIKDDCSVWQKPEYEKYLEIAKEEM